jgi:hypothetical protein
VVDKMMKSLNFVEEKYWNYDICHIISNLRVTISYATYIHHADLDIEILARKESWIEVQEVQQGQHVFITCKASCQ